MKNIEIPVFNSFKLEIHGMNTDHFDLKLIGCDNFVSGLKYSGSSKQIGNVKLKLRIILELLGIWSSPQEFVSSIGIQDLSSVVAGTNAEFNRKVLDLIFLDKEMFISNMNYFTSSSQQLIDSFCDTDSL